MNFVLTTDELRPLLPWVRPAFDLTVVVLLGLVLRRLGRDAARDPAATWRQREERLQEIFDGLKGLVAAADAQAREVDEKLAAHAERLRTWVPNESAPPINVEPRPRHGERRRRRSEARSSRPAKPRRERAVGGRGVGRVPAAEPLVATAASPPESAIDLPLDATDPAAERIVELEAAGTPIHEIARVLGISVAEVRLVIALRAAVAAEAAGRSGTARTERAATKTGQVLPSIEPVAGEAARAAAAPPASQEQFHGTSIA